MSSSYNKGQKSWHTSGGGGGGARSVFQFTHAESLPSPHKQRWTRVFTIFSKLQICVGCWEGELQENFEKDALFYEGNQKLQKNYEYYIIVPDLAMIDWTAKTRRSRVFFRQTLWSPAYHYKRFKTEVNKAFMAIKTG